MRQIDSSIGSGHGPSGILLGSVGVGLVGFLRNIKPQRPLACKKERPKAPREMKKGFTLLEILIIVVILGILVAVIPQFTKAPSSQIIVNKRINQSVAYWCLKESGWSLEKTCQVAKQLNIKSVELVGIEGRDKLKENWGMLFIATVLKSAKGIRQKWVAMME